MTRYWVDFLHSNIQRKVIKHLFKNQLARKTLCVKAFLDCLDLIVVPRDYIRMWIAKSLKTVYKPFTFNSSNFNESIFRECKFKFVKIVQFYIEKLLMNYSQKLKCLKVKHFNRLVNLGWRWGLISREIKASEACNLPVVVNADNLYT